MTKPDHVTALIYSHEQSQHVLSPTHPMRPIRLMHMHDLMQATGLIGAPGIRLQGPRVATDHEILAFHSPDYVEVVKMIDVGGIVLNMHEYGFGPMDNPPRRGLFRHAALAAGGALLASELVLDGSVRNAFAPAGGMHHHAMSERASGFGIFNDAVIAIKRLIEEEMRVLYVDIDVHHGDGVQAGFYESDQVLTVSIHESGQWLFPGTGFPTETGRGDGEGFSVNLPLAPYTDDDLWHETFDAIVPPLAHAFEPDILFTQLGIDTHRDDPLAHLSLTTQGHNLAVRKFAGLADELKCGWISVGGGGYDMSAVARAWTMDLGTMAEIELPNEVPTSFTSLDNVVSFDDPTGYRMPDDIREDAVRHNQAAIEDVKRRTFPKFGL